VNANDDLAGTYDLIILGAGAAGMSAAVTGASLGLSVLVAEASTQVGGTTAISAGSLWVPNSALDVWREEEPDAARTYLEAAVGNRSAEPLRRAFLDRGPEMIAYLSALGAIDLVAYPYHPDYLADAPGAVTRGRALGTRPFDGRRLGPDLSLLRAPPPEFTILGGMMVDRGDITHLLNVHRSLSSFLHAARLVLRHGRDRVAGPRGTRLVMGNALAGRLLWSMRRLGVTVRTGARADEILKLDGKAWGVSLGGASIRARLGVVVATGGFSHHPQLRDRLFPRPTAAHSAVPASTAGGGIDLVLRAGGRLSQGHANAAFWAPASLRRRADGSLAVFPHFVLDRAKPGIIAIDGGGRRFVNESTSYQLFAEAMQRPGVMPCHLVCNGAFIRKYGLGMIRPLTRDLRPHLADGYVAEGATLSELAARIGVDAAALADSAARNDRYARDGVDPDFGRGRNAYNRNLGDPAHGPNPSLGPIGEGPYYALSLHPADIGTSIGVETDAHARVLDAAGMPIPGLYAAGNDMSSIMGGVYPGPGITIGPAMTFGYVAARHAARDGDPGVPT
jgi:succinate dehydrogenase/fumarate reductase flavoprotein subunit